MSFDPKKVVPDPDFEVPDLIGTVEGWRAWKVARELPLYNTAPKLYSATAKLYYWIPRQRMEAECKKTRPCSETVGVPGENCRCGFYSAKNLDHLKDMGYERRGVNRNTITVVGRIANWGKVIEGSQGWRSQYAYPIEIFVPFQALGLGRAISEAYGVPVKPMKYL